MAFEILGSSGRTARVPDLIARRRYDEAIELLKEQLKRTPGDTPLRMQAAEVLVLQGKIENATRILEAVADEFATQGFAAKSIAVLKKIQKLDPSRRDLEARIVELFKSTAPPPRSGDFREWKPQDLDHNVRSATPAPRLPVAEPADHLPSSFDAAGVSQFGILAPDEGDTIDVGSLAPSAPDAASPARPVAPPPLAHETPIVVDIEQFTQATPETGPRAARVSSPLFDDFSEDELLEVVRRLELLTFEPGDILVTEGEEGDSLYVLTSGTAKAFVRNKRGGSTQVRELNEGDFFGEISILTGKPRSATITAAEACELLRLDRPALELITATRPRVREVLQQFYFERAHNVAEAEIRGLESGATETLRQAGLADDQAAQPGAPVPVAQDSDDSRVQHLRAVAIEQSRKQNWADAVQAWQQFIALRPDDADAANALGVLFGKLGRWKEAAQTFERIAELRPEDATNLFNLGVSYRQLDVLPLAASAFTKSLAIKPDYEKARQALTSVVSRIRKMPADAQA